MPSTAIDVLPSHGLGHPIDVSSYSLIGLARPVHWARTMVRDALEGLADTERIRDAVLVTDELVSNAVRHAGGAVSLSLGIFENGLTVAVTDRPLPPASTSVVPAGLMAGPDEASATAPELGFDALPECGRGLLLVSELTTAWSVTHTKTAKIVTAAFAVGGDVLDRP
jgi:anti-sigma regulatory factor (Ser/Thr protein kinase)